jgi:hypothetical protein
MGTLVAERTSQVSNTIESAIWADGRYRSDRVELLSRKYQSSMGMKMIKTRANL